MLSNQEWRENLEEQKKEYNILKQKLLLHYREQHKQEIPEEVWDILRPRGEYLIEIMKYCAFDTVDSALELKDENKQKEMSAFVLKMIDVIEDKEKLLGIFAELPEKLQLLPGLRRKFNNFLEALKSLRAPKVNRDSAEVGASHQKRKNNSMETEAKKVKKQPSIDTKGIAHASND